jgi:hypothetical protein
MTVEHEVTQQRIRNALVRKFMEQIELRPVESLPCDDCTTEPDGWELYSIHWVGRCAVGGGEYLAYHPGLDDVILLDVLGE